MKENWRPGTMIYPLPAVIVSCGKNIPESNLITVAWVGITCSDPAMCYISVRPERYSYNIIKESMEFTINLTTKGMASQTDWIGVRSGKDFNKWKETGLTPVPGVKVNCPSIDESPLSLECKVKTIIPLGTHDMFLAEIVNVRAERSLIDETTGKFQLEKANLLTYSHGQYHEVGDIIGHFGFSVRKKS